MGRKWSKFKLLMWKNYVIQKRHPISTAFEILAPIIFTALLVIARSLVDPQPFPSIIYAPFSIKMEVLEHYKLLRVIVWAPQNPELEKIMDKAVNGMSTDAIKVRHVPMKNRDLLREYLYNEVNLFTTLAGVEFEDSLAEAKKLPSEMHVTLRFPSEQRSSTAPNVSMDAESLGATWMTHILFPVFQFPGPRGHNLTHGAYPSISIISNRMKRFLKLQLEISLALLEYFKQEQKGREARAAFNVQLQRFPYPAWTQDNLLIVLQGLASLVIMLGFTYTCISIVKYITVEKEKQLKEAMKIMGLPNWLHWLAWFLNAYIIFLITTALIVVIVTTPWFSNNSHTVFTKSNPFAIFLFFQFYAFASITFCFAISSFFSKANVATGVAGLLWFLSRFPFAFFFKQYSELSLTTKLLLCLFSNSAVGYGVQLIVMLEGLGTGLQWNNIWESVSSDDSLVMGHVMIMLTLDTIIYLLVALYVEAVFPGDYGVPQPWNFPLVALGCKSKAKAHVEIYEPTEEENSAFCEREPTDLTVGIKIKHLKKVYENSKTAINNLNLTMYNNQITVLLGHNGAGKTTTMSILTGMITPTSGTAVINGYNIKTDMPKIRDSLGLCPQHNVIFDELTVREHLKFFSVLKGLSKRDAKNEIKKYLELLELTPKANTKAENLSGGMKRKLSIGVALCGGSKVVMLDEPTAGVDPAARRAIWDLLQSQKNNRTILLTTHFMDEADLLGDRIAIMKLGVLQCCGSSFFLKKKYGAGYHLIMEKAPSCNVENVTKLLQKYIPDIEVENNIGSELTYLLDDTYAPVFEKMLGNLEAQSAELKVSSYGISLTTLEEVFTKSGADNEESGSTVSKDTDTNTTKSISSTVSKDSKPLGVQSVSNAPSKDSKPTGSTKLAPGPSGLKDPKPAETPSSASKDSKQSKNTNTSKAESKNVMPSKTTYSINMKGEDDFIIGCPLWRNQILAMFMKRGLTIWRSRMLLLIQLLVPILFMTLAIIVIRKRSSMRELPKRSIDLISYKDPITTLTAQGDSKYADSYMSIAKEEESGVINWENGDFAERIMSETLKDTTKVRKRCIVGASFQSDSSATAWFNNIPYHSPALTLQLLLNSILQTEVSPGHYIKFYNHPLPYTIDSQFKSLGRRSLGSEIAFNIGFCMTFISSFYILFYIRERVTKAKHLQVVSGTNLGIFWLTSFICDLLSFTLTSLFLIIAMLTFQEDGFKTFPELCRFYFILFYFAMSFLPMMYFFSFLFDVPSTGFIRMTLLNLFAGVAAYLAVIVLQTPEVDLTDIADTMHTIFMVVPIFNMCMGIRDSNVLYMTHKICDEVLDKCLHLLPPHLTPYITEEECWKRICVKQPQCCTMTKNYYAWESPGIGRNVFYAFAEALIFFLVIFLIELRVMEAIEYYCSCMLPKPKEPPLDPNEDSDVKAERDKINSASEDELKSYALAMKNVTKYYKKFLAVNNISLSINKFECFGLLGVNGAGKTSTFKMMTGDSKMSCGSAWVNGYSLKTQMIKVRRTIGYCPQFDALLDELTCRETLIMFSLIRGATLRQSKLTAEALSHNFDFHRHFDKRVKQLSGGNKRKLSTAVSLIGNPSVVYLDEPTTGIDIATKRYLWNALCKLRDRGKSIVLTSHSMEECEALCTRLAIMVNGKFKCLGSTQHLKNKFSVGYTLIVKVGKPKDKPLGQVVQNVETFVRVNFPSAMIREKHEQLIVFYIPDKALPWSKMFGIMESNKQKLDIEDYSLSQCSLEQVFLTFTKYQTD